MSEAKRRNANQGVGIQGAGDDSEEGASAGFFQQADAAKVAGRKMARVRSRDAGGASSSGSGSGGGGGSAAGMFGGVAASGGAPKFNFGSGGGAAAAAPKPSPFSMPASASGGAAPAFSFGGAAGGAAAAPAKPSFNFASAPSKPAFGAPKPAADAEDDDDGPAVPAMAAPKLGAFAFTGGNTGGFPAPAFGSAAMGGGGDDEDVENEVEITDEHKVEGLGELKKQEMPDPSVEEETLAEVEPAKLYRFEDGSWKELLENEDQKKGKFKLLRNKKGGHVRMEFRRLFDSGPPPKAMLNSFVFAGQTFTVKGAAGNAITMSCNVKNAMRKDEEPEYVLKNFMLKFGKGKAAALHAALEKAAESGGGSGGGNGSDDDAAGRSDGDGDAGGGSGSDEDDNEGDDNEEEAAAPAAKVGSSSMWGGPAATGFGAASSAAASSVSMPRAAIPEEGDRCEQFTKLNSAFKTWVVQQLDSNDGTFDLTPGLQDYLKHARSLQETA